MSLTVDRSSQQAAHVQDAAWGFRIRSCQNTHTHTHTLQSNTATGLGCSAKWVSGDIFFEKGSYCELCMSVHILLWLCVCVCGLQRPIWPEWDTVEVGQRSGCFSSSLCCSLSLTYPQTQSGCTSYCCVWYSALFPLRSKVKDQSLAVSQFLKQSGVCLKSCYIENSIPEQLK